MTTNREYILRKLPKRALNSNKGSFGKLLLICGSHNMRGAAALALLGALRTGVGLTYLAAEKEVVDALSASIYEAIWLDCQNSSVLECEKNMSAVAFGCGTGQSDDKKELLFSLIKKEGSPLLIDADGINLLAKYVDILKEAKRKILLTPHPLEFSRISGIDVAEIQSNREKAAEDFANKYNVVLLLKGNRTVITDGKITFVNPTGSSALAKGGSGDVLTGIVSSMMAQGCDVLDAAVIGAYLHGLAGERLAKVYSDYGVLPSELPGQAAKILAELSI